MKDEKRTIMVQFKINASEAAIINGAVKKSGMPRGTYCRAVILAHIKEEEKK